MQSFKKVAKEKLRNAVAPPPPLDFSHIRQIATVSRTDAEYACRNAAQAVYLGDDTVLCRVLMKYLFYVDARDIGITPHLCLNGFWETWITQTFVRTIQPGWNCVDVGANQGYFSVLMADLASTGGNFAAVEPNPKLIKFLAKNLEVNGFYWTAQIINKAVGERDGEKLKLVIPEGRALNATIFAAEVNANDEVIEIETITLDKLTKDWERVDFIKIDAEGAEEAIWRGMKETIRRNPQIVIVMEINCGRYQNPRAFLEQIVADGFQLRHINFDGQIEELTLKQTLTERPSEDWMLFLQR